MDEFHMEFWNRSCAWYCTRLSIHESQSFKGARRETVLIKLIFVALVGEQMFFVVAFRPYQTPSTDLVATEGQTSQFDDED